MCTTFLPRRIENKWRGGQSAFDSSQENKGAPLELLVKARRAVGFEHPYGYPIKNPLGDQLSEDRSQRHTAVRCGHLEIGTIPGWAKDRKAVFGHGPPAQSDFFDRRFPAAFTLASFIVETVVPSSNPQ